MIRNRRTAVHAAAVLFTLASVAARADSPSARPNEFSSLGRQAGAISAAVGKQDMSGASEGLNGLFTGSGLKRDASGGSLVAAGEWRIAPRLDLATHRSRPSSRRDEPAGISTLGGDREGHGAKFITVSVGGAAAEEALRRAAEAARKAEEALRRHAERDQTEESKQKYGGCRMNNTCPK